MIFALALYMLINTDRAASTTPPVAYSYELGVKAQARAEDLCAKNQWSHAGWTDSFQGLNWKYAGENLAKDFPDATSTNAALMASPTHKANIMKPQYTRIGVGHSCDITVELFADGKDKTLAKK